MSFFTMPLRKNWLMTQKPLFMMLAVMPAGGHAAYTEWARAGGRLLRRRRTSVYDGGVERERHAVLLRVLPVVGRLEEAHICAPTEARCRNVRAVAQRARGLGMPAVPHSRPTAQFSCAAHGRQGRCACAQRRESWQLRLGAHARTYHVGQPHRCQSFGRDEVTSPALILAAAGCDVDLKGQNTRTVLVKLRASSSKEGRKEVTREFPHTRKKNRF